MSTNQMRTRKTDSTQISQFLYEYLLQSCRTVGLVLLEKFTENLCISLVNRCRLYIVHSIKSRSTTSTKLAANALKFTDTNIFDWYSLFLFRLDDNHFICVRALTGRRTDATNYIISLLCGR